MSISKSNLAPPRPSENDGRTVSIPDLVKDLRSLASLLNVGDLSKSVQDLADRVRKDVLNLRTQYFQLSRPLTSEEIQRDEARYGGTWKGGTKPLIRNGEKLTPGEQLFQAFCVAANKTLVALVTEAHPDPAEQQKLISAAPTSLSKIAAEIENWYSDAAAIARDLRQWAMRPMPPLVDAFEWETHIAPIKGFLTVREPQMRSIGTTLRISGRDGLAVEFEQHVRDSLNEAFVILTAGKNLCWASDEELLIQVGDNPHVLAAKRSQREGFANRYQLAIGAVLRAAEWLEQAADEPVGVKINQGAERGAKRISNGKQTSEEELANRELDISPQDESGRPKRGRLSKEDSEARKMSMLGILRQHPSMLKDETALAKNIGVSSKTIKRWLSEEKEKYKNSRNKAGDVGNE